MWNRGRPANLVASLLAFWVFMCVLLGFAGFGIGVGELLIWLTLLAVSSVLIVRRFRSARLLF
ncbi:hypothetical protein GCM10009623_32640 [Nocardioides aestuarii]